MSLEAQIHECERKIQQCEQKSAACMQLYDKTGRESYRREAAAFSEIAEREHARMMRLLAEDYN